MILNILVLFIGTFLGGLLIYVVKTTATSLKLPLVFAGSFLFAVTVIHILPELFSVSPNPMEMGMVVLLGFFFQQFLETFTSGVEHGHYHKGELSSNRRKAGLIGALVIHSVLEGSLLNHESPFHHQHESHSLLLGILFHKIPAAFALMAVIKGQKGFRMGDLVILFIFSISSPVGLLLSNAVIPISSPNMIFLFAFVSGSFLHISTTIFVETSPNHHLGLKRTLVGIGGALLAILAEYLS